MNKLNEYLELEKQNISRSANAKRLRKLLEEELEEYLADKGIHGEVNLYWQRNLHLSLYVKVEDTTIELEEEVQNPEIVLDKWIKWLKYIGGSNE